MKKQKIIAEYKMWTKGMRQAAKIKNDLKNLEKQLKENKEYKVFYRQYTGHDYIPKKINNKFSILFISQAIAWPQSTAPGKRIWGQNFVIVEN